MKLTLIPPNTKMESNGDGASFDISGSATRTFLCLLTVADQLEQESLDVSIYGSAEGITWTPKPLLKLPQQFYRGSTKMVLDLSLRPEVKFIRDRKSTRLNSSHVSISYAVFCLKKKKLLKYQIFHC